MISPTIRKRPHSRRNPDLQRDTTPHLAKRVARARPGLFFHCRAIWQLTAFLYKRRGISPQDFAKTECPQISRPAVRVRVERHRQTIALSLRFDGGQACLLKDACHAVCLFQKKSCQPRGASSFDRTFTTARQWGRDASIRSPSIAQ
jgi:hypothetical protein